MPEEDEEVTAPEYLGEWLLERLDDNHEAFTTIMENIAGNWTYRVDPHDVVGEPEYGFDQEALTVACVASKPLRDACRKVKSPIETCTWSRTVTQSR